MILFSNKIISSRAFSITGPFLFINIKTFISWIFKPLFDSWTHWILWILRNPKVFIVISRACSKAMKWTGWSPCAIILFYFSFFNQIHNVSPILLKHIFFNKTAFSLRVIMQAFDSQNIKHWPLIIESLNRKNRGFYLSNDILSEHTFLFL